MGIYYRLAEIRGNLQLHAGDHYRLLSVIIQIFDLLGLIGPVVIKAKILLQLLWQQKLDWDARIPETIRIVWASYC